MRIEEALATKLLATAGVTALVGTRVYPVQAPQETTASYIVYDFLGGLDHTAHDGSGGLRQGRVSFSCSAATYAAAKAVAEAVRTVFFGFSGTLSGLAVKVPIVYEDEDLLDEVLRRYVVVVDLELFWSG